MLSSLKWVENAALIEKDLSAMFQAKREVLDGFISSAKGMAQDAIQKCEDALAISPKDYDATYLLAKLNYEIGSRFKDARRLDEATRAYEKSIKAVDNFIAGDRVLLSEHFALEVIYAKAHLDLGVMAFNANRLKEAVAAFQKAVSGEVRFAEAHNNLGVAYARLGKDDAAVIHYQRAIELNPHLVSARRNLGNLRLRQAKYQEAIESYRQVQKLKPDLALTHYNLGVAYFQQNEWARAEKEWVLALALKPDFAQAQKTLNGLRNRMKLR
jgi:tetratricopeptide (TPR) repeat protein